MKRKEIFSLIICIAIVYAVAFIGASFSINETNSAWYESIKPSITPPNYVFPIVWNILYILIGIAIFYSWNSTKTKNKKQRKTIITLFGINLVANAFWSFLFFKLQNPQVAFLDILIILSTIIFIMKKTWKINRKTTYFLIPYLIWICFATVLNVMIVLKTAI